MTNKFTTNFHHFESPEDILLAYDKSIQEGSVQLYPWQIKFLREFAKDATSQDPIKQLLIANNGAGKSQFILAPCIVWLAVSFDNSLGYVTSSSASQLDTQTERYIDLICNTMNEKHRKEFGGRDIWDIVRRKKQFLPTKGFVDLFATDEPKRAEGKHPLVPNGEFGIFIDEGKSVDEEIYDAISRCHGYTRRLDSSSPGGCIGHFHRCATAENTDYSLIQANILGWKSLRVTSFDCPHISQNEIRSLILEKGLHHPIVRSTHFAEFTSVNEQVVVPIQIYDDCKRYFTKSVNFLNRRAGLDLAAGGDEVVLSVWEGNINLAQEVMRGNGIADTTPIVNTIIEWINKWRIKPDDIIADDGGVGRGIISHLSDKGYKVQRMLNQWRAVDNTHYSNRGTENWFNFKRFVEEYQLKLIDDPILRSQITNRYYKNNAKLLLQLESKAEAKAKGHPSPDRADAAVLAWANIPYPCKFITGEDLGKDKDESKNSPKLEALSEAELIQWYRSSLFTDYHKNKRHQQFQDSNKEPEPITQSLLMERLDKASKESELLNSL